jgi:hypothetical protein
MSTPYLICSHIKEDAVAWVVNIGTLQTGYPTYRLQIKTRSRVCIHVLPCVLQLRTSPLPTWALALPCVVQFWTLPPCRCGLQRCYVFRGPGPRLPAGVGSGAATCSVAPGSPPSQGGPRRCRVSHGSRPRLSTGGLWCRLTFHS